MLFRCTLIVLAERKEIGGAATYDNNLGVTLVTAANRRNPPHCLDSAIHHNNLLNNILVGDILTLHPHPRSYFAVFVGLRVVEAVEMFYSYRDLLTLIQSRVEPRTCPVDASETLHETAVACHVIILLSGVLSVRCMLARKI